MRFVSVAGKWYPAKEWAINPNAKPGENPVYEGPDRGAMEYMKENGLVDEKGNILDYPGQDCFTDPDNMMKARTLGYKNAEEHVKEIYGIDRKKVEDAGKKHLEKLTLHDQKVTPGLDRSPLGGGFDATGQGRDRKGGFGEPDDVSASALKQRA